MLQLVFRNTPHTKALAVLIGRDQKDLEWKDLLNTNIDLSATPATMVVYRRCNKSELAKFTRDRGIRVQSSGRRPNKPLKRDLTAALQDADANRTFRFLDLPPELRNMVYRELLAMDPAPAGQLASPKCHPQILCASKEVNGEASGILYGNNVIEVTIHPTGVYAHGIRCGTYLPAPPTNAQQRREPKGEDLKWPNFLHRAQLIRVTSSGMLDGQANRLKLPNCGTLHNILFSLCDFLHFSTSLRSVDLDIAWLSQQYLSLGHIDTLMKHLPTAVYPLRMLDDRVAVQIEGVEATNLQLPLKPDNIAVENARRIVSGSLPSCCHQLHAIFRTEVLLYDATKFAPIHSRPIMLTMDFLILTSVGITLTLRAAGGRSSLRSEISGSLQILPANSARSLGRIAG